MLDNTQNRVYSSAAAVTTSDTANTNIYHTLYVGTTGNVKVTTKDGDDVTFTGVPAGAFLWISVTRVYSTGTTASTILGLK